jgi:hypothetical protein
MRGRISDRPPHPVNVTPSRTTASAATHERGADGGFAVYALTSLTRQVIESSIGIDVDG